MTNQKDIKVEKKMVHVPAPTKEEYVNDVRVGVIRHQENKQTTMSKILNSNKQEILVRTRNKK